ncbi:MAG: class I SAM-dependent methyltransferase [Candidatus Sericytochromatia bacterium]
MRQPDALSDAAVLSAWHENAAPWTEAVRAGQIVSRVKVTDQAIVQAVLRQRPQDALDLGCGEGWLCRELAAAGVEMYGVDAVAELVASARASGGAQFYQHSYQEIAAGALALQVDAVIANFSLIGQKEVEAVLAAVPSLLRPGGALLIQTLHPLMACGEDPYSDGWRPGSWAGFSSAFGTPAPWYFRTLESWLTLLHQLGFVLEALQEPLHPDTQKPASLILLGKQLP